MNEIKIKKLICPMTFANKKPGFCLGSGCAVWISNTPVSGFCSIGRQTGEGFARDTSPNNQGQ